VDEEPEMTGRDLGDTEQKVLYREGSLLRAIVGRPRISGDGNFLEVQRTNGTIYLNIRSVIWIRPLAWPDTAEPRP
jgi:hypothetical protein